MNILFTIFVYLSLVLTQGRARLMGMARGRVQFTWLQSLNVKIVFLLPIILSFDVHARSKVCLNFYQRSFFNQLVAENGLEIFTMSASRIKSKEVLVTSLRDKYVLLEKSVSGLVSKEQIFDSLIYPMAGYDLTTPLSLFPNVKNILMIDNHSVVSANELSKFITKNINTYLVDHNNSWVKYDSVNDQIFKKLLTSLFTVIPNAVVKNVEFILDQLGGVSLILKFYDPV